MKHEGILIAALLILSTATMVSVAPTPAWAPEPGMGSRNDRGSDSGPGHSGSSGRDTSQPAGSSKNPITKCSGPCGYEGESSQIKPPRGLAPGAKGDSLNIGDRSGVSRSDRSAHGIGQNRDTSNKN